MTGIKKGPAVDFLQHSPEGGAELMCVADSPLPNGDGFRIGLAVTGAECRGRAVQEIDLLLDSLDFRAKSCVTPVSILGKIPREINLG